MLCFGTHQDQMIKDVHGMSFHRQTKEGRKGEANRRTEVSGHKRGSNSFFLYLILGTGPTEHMG